MRATRTRVPSSWQPAPALPLPRLSPSALYSVPCLPSLVCFSPARVPGPAWHLRSPRLVSPHCAKRTPPLFHLRTLPGTLDVWALRGGRSRFKLPVPARQEAVGAPGRGAVAGGSAVQPGAPGLSCWWLQGHLPGGSPVPSTKAWAGALLPRPRAAQAGQGVPGERDSLWPCHFRTTLRPLPQPPCGEPVRPFYSHDGGNLQRISRET